MFTMIFVTKLANFKSSGINVKYHHHEVGERGQQEIETYFADLLNTADNIITAKYILFNFAQQKGSVILHLCQSQCISRPVMECIYIFI